MEPSGNGSPIAPGVVICDRYIVEEKIGEGARGEVWAARHSTVGMRVAIKVLVSEFSHEKESIARFKREAYFLGRIQSAHVAKLYDFIADDVYGLVLVLELIEGESLDAALRKDVLSVEAVIDLGIDILRGVCDLHHAGLVHRDLKPGNIMMRPQADGSEQAVIVDFGLSRALENTGGEERTLTPITGSNMMLGTMPYMAPEQVLDARKASVKSDVYAVGTIMFRAVSGRLPFEIDLEVALVKSKLIAEAPPLETFRDDPIAQRLTQIVSRAVKRRPAERHESAKQMLDELIELRDRARAQALKAAGSGATPSLAPRKSLAKQVVLGLVLLVGGGALGAAAVTAIRDRRNIARDNNLASTASVSSGVGSPVEAAALAAPVDAGADASSEDASHASDASIEAASADADALIAIIDDPVPAPAPTPKPTQKRPPPPPPSAEGDPPTPSQAPPTPVPTPAPTPAPEE